MTLRYGEEISTTQEDEYERPWYKSTVEFVLLLCLFLLVCAGTAYRSITKTVVIDEEITEDIYSGAFDQEVTTDWTVMNTKSITGSESFIVPLPMTAVSNGISVENYYQDHTLFVRIKGSRAGNFENTGIEGAVDHIVSAAYREYSGELHISLLMDGVWDYDISKESGKLVITPYKAHDRYDKVILLVPAYDMRDADDVTARVAESAIGILAENEALAGQDPLSGEGSTSSEKAVARIYSARTPGNARTEEEIFALIRDCEADAVVFLELSESTDPQDYGMRAVYNDEYFLPGINNALVAETFLRNIAVSASDKAISIDGAQADDILKMIEKPSARISIGFLTNEKEYGFLKDERYRKKIAEGIINAIKEVCEN